MDLPPRMAEQITEAAQTARGFEVRSLPLISNRPVIALPSEDRLFVRAQDRAIREGFLQGLKEGGDESPWAVGVRVMAIDAPEAIAHGFERFIALPFFH